MRQFVLFRVKSMLVAHALGAVGCCNRCIGDERTDEDMFPFVVGPNW